MKKDAIVKPGAGGLNAKGPPNKPDPITQLIQIVVNAFRAEEGKVAVDAMRMGQHHQGSRYALLALNDSPEIARLRGNHKGRIMARWDTRRRKFVSLEIPVNTTKGAERITVDLSKFEGWSK